MENQSYIRRSRSKIILAGVVIVLVFATAIFGQTASPTPDKRDNGLQSNQRPRVFYRREMETNPLVVAKPTAPGQ
ncbi:MAG TPA: hypothetical protein VNG71_08365 [Pyrinomonadaceae bacterium]|nr:hypothetical protein [Pyrinomonadaceae bacterium]